MKYKRYNLVGVVEDVFEDRDIVWPDNTKCSENEDISIRSKKRNKK